MKHKPGYANRRGGLSRRAGFSLAELMIAIGILGIGMLMVASTFPVGIEQTRRVTNDTMGPIIANEAFAMMEMLLKDTGKHVAVDVDINEKIEQGEWARLADLIKYWPAKSVQQGGQPHDATCDVGIDNTGSSIQFNINLWLLDQKEDITGNRGYLQAYGAPTPSPADTDPTKYLLFDSNGIAITKYPLAPLAAVYPSRMPAPSNPQALWPPSLAGYPYYWSVLYRFPNAQPNGAGGFDPASLQSIQLITFVNRRAAVGYDAQGLHGLPVRFYIGWNVDTGRLEVLDNPEEKFYPAMTGLQIANFLDRDMTLVQSNSGDVYTIRDIHTDSSTAWLELDPPFGGLACMWTIWRDPSAGVSPTIGVFKRTLQLE